MYLSFKELKGVTRLYSDYLYAYQNLADFYNGDFRQLSSFQAIQTQIQSQKYPRPALAEILSEQNRSFGAGQKTLANIEALKEKKCCVVFTGQQIGLFGGPLYTIYKSLTAIKLAERLSDQLEIRVVPLFWMATDDHDFAEINHVYFVDNQNKLVRLEYQPQEEWNGYPASQIILDEKINQTLEILESSNREGKFNREILKPLKEFYAQGQPYYLAFARWMSFLLSKYGLVLLNPADTRFKTLLSSIFTSELEKNGELQNLVEKTNFRLEKLNYHRQVHKLEKVTNLFYHSPRRVHISRENGKFRWEGSTRSLDGAAMVKLVENSPQDFSANVLLRPVLESFLFPNLAHVAGPSEVAYFAQIKALHKELKVVMPVIYPRQSLTLVEPEIKNILAKSGISCLEVMQDVEQVYNHIIEGKIPKEAERLLNRTQRELKDKVESMGEEILKIQPGLKPNLEFTQGKIDFEFNKFKEKFFQAYKKQFKQVKDELYTVRDSIYPQDALQERTYNITPFLGRYGFDFIDYLYQSLILESFDHQILYFDEADSLFDKRMEVKDDHDRFANLEK